MGCGCSSSFSGKTKSKKASFVGKKKVDKAKLKNRFNSFMGKSTKVDMRKHNIPMEDFSAYNTIDLCGTGGDGKDTFNISTLSSFVTAGAGVKVAKHGNYGVSSSCGSSNVLEFLGIRFTNNEEKLIKAIEPNAEVHYTKTISEKTIVI